MVMVMKHAGRATFLELITRFDDRYAEAKFSKSTVLDKVPEGSTLSADTLVSLKHSVG